jgi:hypothetical protein
MRIVIELHTRRETNEVSRFAREIVQRLDSYSIHPSAHPIAGLRGNHNARHVFRRKLPEFNEEQTAVFGEWRMSRAGRIAQIGARRIAAMFVFEKPFDNEDFLTAAVFVKWKKAAWLKPDKTGCARNLIADAIKHQAVDAFLRRGNPLRLARPHYFFARKIGPNLHLVLHPVEPLLAQGYSRPNLADRAAGFQLFAKAQMTMSGPNW